ncbi:hypothetical protein QUC31_000920 [Theobroma cacao]|uniref:Histone-lysine N-methyltransferase ASHR1 n=1 Tax=Theobroma cacao TaxID=3641 RepID=A0AB32WQA5_THECC|nr:PREDICTED: histone-lysine N-methyltransferase ASHR1 [Theobroma cacao]XP_017980931.1 PREDICTED: histone-lysine N-methyltransferase ASHR1 [Theobroma cacao]
MENLELQDFPEAEGLSVSYILPKGRGLFAKKAFTPGEVIIREEPYVNESASPFPVCKGCFESQGLLKCSACQFVWYCGSECQRLDWRLHCISLNIVPSQGLTRRGTILLHLRYV